MLIRCIFPVCKHIETKKVFNFVPTGLHTYIALRFYRYLVPTGTTNLH